MDELKQVNHLSALDILRGTNVSLSPPRIDDLVFTRALWSDADTMEVVGGIVELSQEKAKKRFADLVDFGGPGNNYCLILNEHGEPVGEVSFHRFDPITRSAGLNIKVLASHRGLGYGKDALATFLAFFFGPVGGRVMTDNVGIGNRLGQRLLLSSGFEIDERFKDVCMMAMTKEKVVMRYGDPNKPVQAVTAKAAAPDL